jgi:endonuclease/exonuclease/phosphatase family metal-dependent hydrolase
MTPLETPGWDPPTRLDGRLRVLTWNVWWRFGPWEARQPAILEHLRRIDADVVCLQEVWETRDGKSQARDLADALGFEHVYAAGLGLDLASESLGNAVLARWPITGSVVCALPAPADRDELRVAIRADVDGPRGAIEVFTTHLNWRLDQSAVRQQQVRALAEFVANTTARRTYPPVLCGDFNADPEADEIRMLTGATAPPVDKLVFLDAWRTAGDGTPGYTWSHANPYTVVDPEPERRLDYVFVGYPQEHAAGQPVRCVVEGVEPVGGISPSDHYAVLAELRY